MAPGLPCGTAGFSWSTQGAPESSSACLLTDAQAAGGPAPSLLPLQGLGTRQEEQRGQGSRGGWDLSRCRNSLKAAPGFSSPQTEVRRGNPGIWERRKSLRSPGKLGNGLNQSSMVVILVTQTSPGLPSSCQGCRLRGLGPVGARQRQQTVWPWRPTCL